MRAEDEVSARLCAEFEATLAGWLFALPETHVPLGLHWCLAPTVAATGALGEDGHPPRAHDVSVSAFPRRMWVGGALEIVAPLKRGARVARETVLAPVEMKSGGSGTWCLTGADHRFTADGDLLISEHQDIAFRPAASAAPPAARAAVALPSGDLRWDIATPPTLLFRYSALTFNSHRIHYDAPYATAVEGYPGLVVHGPLQATLLLNLAATLLGRSPRTFRYRATAPLIAGEGLHAIARVEGEGVAASVHAADGTETLRATAA
jgi:3-methylfumaryl-CoA hydratase